VRAGLSVLTLERHSFPRFRIGESLTAIAGDHLRALGLGEEMDRHRFPNKTGVMVVGREAKSEFFVPVLTPTWQVRRAEFDQMLLHCAIAEGVEHRFGTVREVVTDGGRPVAVSYTPEGYNAATSGREERIGCRFVVDASGHSAVLSRLGVAGPRKIDLFDRQVAVFSHYHEVERDPGPMFDNTFIFYGETFHWAWFIPLSHLAVSIGVVVPSQHHKKYGGAEQLLAWGLETINPDLTRRMKRARAVEPVRFICNYSYRVEPFVGDGWLCIGDAHRFTDPIFSFGVAMSMAEGECAAKVIRRHIDGGDWREVAAEYTAYSDRAQDAIYDTIRYFWAYPAFFGMQARGANRQDIIRLLAGDCWGDDPVPALKMFRESLAKVPMPQIEEAAQ
jgi:flavin-dependent dehydrogenase